MKITCLKEELEKAVSKAERITSKNSSLPVLRGIFFSVKNKILLNSTNLDLGVEIMVPGKIEKEGSVIVDGGVLNSFLSNIQNNNNLTLETKDNKLQITSKNTKTNISTLPNNDFPLIPKPKNKKSIKIKSESLINGLRSVWFSTANSNIKPELSSVYIYPERETIVFVATDAFRLAEKKVLVNKNFDFDPILLPSKNIPEIIKNLEEAQEEIDVFFDETQISFFYKNNFLTSRTTSGVFPDYKQLLPKESKTEVILLKEDFIRSLRVSNIFADKFNQITLRVSPSKKILTIQSQNQEKGENISSVEATTKGDEIEIGFNYKYIMETFPSIFSDSISLSLIGPAKPMLIKGVSDTTFVYLIMPMNK